MRQKGRTDWNTIPYTSGSDTEKFIYIFIYTYNMHVYGD